MEFISDSPSEQLSGYRRRLHRQCDPHLRQPHPPGRMSITSRASWPTESRTSNPMRSSIGRAQGRRRRSVFENAGGCLRRGGQGDLLRRASSSMSPSGATSRRAARERDQVRTLLTRAGRLLPLRLRYRLHHEFISDAIADHLRLSRGDSSQQRAHLCEHHPSRRPRDGQPTRDEARTPAPSLDRSRIVHRDARCAGL